MTRILDGMQKKGLVQRKADENDRRVQRIYVTQRGKELEKPLREIATANMKKGLEGLPTEDINNLTRILDVIINNY